MVSLAPSSEDVGFVEQPVVNRRALDSLSTSAGGESGARFLRHWLIRWGAIVELLASVEGGEVGRTCRTSPAAVRISIGGIINDLQPQTTKKGDRFALLAAGRRSRRNEVCAVAGDLSEVFGAGKNELPVLVTGRLELSEDNPPSIIVDQVQSLDEMSKAKELVVLRVPQAEDPAELFDSILHLINTQSG